MPQIWKDYLSSEVDRVMSRGAFPIDLAQERVVLALTLTLVKGVCELVPSVTRNLFNAMLQYINHRRARWLFSCRIRGNHLGPLRGRRLRRHTAGFASLDSTLKTLKQKWKLLIEKNNNWKLCFDTYIFGKKKIYIFSLSLFLYLYLKSMSYVWKLPNAWKKNLNKFYYTILRPLFFDLNLKWSAN